MKRVRAYPPPTRHKYSIEDMPGIIVSLLVLLGLCAERGWL